MKVLSGLFAAGVAAVAGIATVGVVAVPASVGSSASSWMSSASDIVPEFHGCSAVVPPPEYPQLEAAHEWAFRDEAATLSFALAKPNARYTATATSDVAAGESGLTVRVRAGDAEVYAFAAHAHTVFDIVGHRLYVAEFQPTKAGVAVRAIDLTTGTELWSTDLKATGTAADVPNRVNLTADETGVTILGREGAGRYVEVLSHETGDRAGHTLLEG